MIGDTSFIIDIMKRRPEALVKLKGILMSDDEFMITTPTIFELFTGLCLSKNQPQEKDKIIGILGYARIVGLDKESAIESGYINGELILKGKQIESEDCMIAGIAKAHHQTIITRNLDHFKRIEGIKVEGY